MTQGRFAWRMGAPVSWPAPPGSGPASSTAWPGGGRGAVSRLLAQLLAKRGIETAEHAERFFLPTLDRLTDPLALPDMPRAVLRIRQAVARQEPVLVFGDSDVDGISAAAIVYGTLRTLGARAVVRLSNRLANGYGFPAALIPRMRRAGIRLLILVDCGTNQPAEIAQLTAAGIDTVILDHHILSPAAAEPVALVNPRRAAAGHEPPNCSAGLAFRLTQALFPAGGDAVERHLDLAALATLADYAELIGDNRILVSAGLERILHTRRPGLRALCEAVELTKATPDQVLKRLVPRLNAAGRLGDPKPVWQLLVEEGDDAAQRFANRLGVHHATTKAMYRQLVSEAHEQANRIHFKDTYVLVIGRRGWHPGLMGPIAAQMVDRFSRPAIVLAFDERVGTGSGRSIESFDLFAALKSCEDLLLRYGGHPQACGLTISSGQVDRFREQINLHARGAITARQLRPSLEIDAEATLAELRAEDASLWDTLKPFGPGNPAPLILLRSVGIEVDGAGTRWLTDGSVKIKARDRQIELSPMRRYDVVVAPAVADGRLVASVRDVQEASEGEVPRDVRRAAAAAVALS